jgi:hypothetical protein
MPSSADEAVADVRALDPTDPKAFQQFLALTGSTADEIHQLGERAQRLGCAAKTTEKKMTSTYPHPTMLLRSIKPGWSQIDGTIATVADDMESRYTLGAPYEDNSCAIDVCLFIGIFTGIGYAQGDQISF